MADERPSSAPPAGRPWKAGFLSLVCAGLFFELLYNFCNWFTARRTDVGTWYFDWELQLPFVPALIVPYWSIDFMFVASFFVCSDLVELRILRRRLVLGIIIASVCFLLFPLRLAFPRPEVDGFYSFWFSALRTFDEPHNLAPSLHILTWAVLWPIYVPRTTGLANLALRAWFVLILVSTVFVYQHHVMDIVTGMVLAIVCLHAVAEDDPAVDRTRRVRNGAVGRLYAAGAAAMLALAIAFWPWGAIMLWPAASLAIVAIGYLWLGAVVYRKFQGTLPLSARVLLAPVLVGQHFSLWHYRRQCQAWDEVAPGVLMGRVLSNREAQEAIDDGVTAVLDLSAEFSEAQPFLVTTYLAMPLLDLTAPTLAQMREAAAFIAEERAGGHVYVHCKIGYSRSAAVIGAWLIDAGLADNVDEVVAILQSARPSVIVRPEARRALAEYAAAM